MGMRFWAGAGGDGDEGAGVTTSVGPLVAMLALSILAVPFVGETQYRAGKVIGSVQRATWNQDTSNAEPLEVQVWCRGDGGP